MRRSRTSHHAAIFREAGRNSRSFWRGSWRSCGSTRKIAGQHLVPPASANSQKATKGLQQDACAFRLRDGGAPLQHVVFFRPDLSQKLHAAPTEQIQIQREAPVDHLNQRQAFMKEFFGDINSLRHYGSEGRIVFVREEPFLTVAMHGEKLQRKIDPIFLKIDGDVLPEIDKLQSGASEIGD